MSPPIVPIQERFWQHVDKSGECWLWIGAKVPRGYGKIGSSSRPIRTLYAHRVSWELANGPIPDGLMVCHTCDVPSCVRPDHLFTATQHDNLMDMSKKRRQSWQVRPEHSPRGEQIGRARLTAEQVGRIRAMHTSGDSQRDLARAFGVTKSCIYHVIARRSWKHVH